MSIDLEKFRRRADSIEKPPLSLGPLSGQSLEKEDHYKTAQYLEEALDEVERLREKIKKLEEDK